MSNIFQAPIKAYQFVSKMLPSNCRYYPTCSEFAMWQFEFAYPHSAFLATTKRILTCNQLFAGGIDYPQVRLKKPIKANAVLNTNYFYGKIIFWIIPSKKRKIYTIIKDYNAISRANNKTNNPTHST